ncbi:hypothetical protein BDZ97DRAFT_302490 [Flammula alnicola]|nr:hypothetical protein BDZ97DRAFT_302490 [Flammula alnicola]
MVSEDDPFHALLEETFTFNIPPGIEQSSEYLEYLDPEYPISFYDRHLDPALVLKHVEVVPSMTQLFSDVCEEEFRAFCATGGTFNSELYEVPGAHTSPSFRNSSDVGKFYNDNIGCCHKFPSMFYFHPGLVEWDTAFDFVVTSGRKPSFLSEAFLRVAYNYRNPQELDLCPSLADNISESAASSLKELAAHSPQLATWECYAMTMSAEKLLKTMQSTPHFKWETSCTMGRTTSIAPLPYPADAKSRFLSKLLGKRALQQAAPKLKPRTRESGVDMSRGSDAIGKSKGIVPSTPRWLSKNQRPYRVSFAHFLQHAWIRAVVNDATFIIFNCGKYERIGVRHRASQTLFLSGLINSITCRNPAYGKLHVGLQTAIINIQDALDRQKLRSKPLISPSVLENPVASNKKRPSENISKDDTKNPKRQKLETKSEDDIDSQTRIIRSALSSRDLALVSLSYGSYRSPVPSSFIRLGPSCAPGFHRDTFEEPDRRASYSSRQYFSLHLSEPMGRGAVGVVHRASAEIRTESGSILNYPLVIKFVFSDQEKQDSLRHEYSIYRHLARASGIEGILPVYGLFEDTDSGTLALIMDDGGTTLRRRKFASTGQSTLITTISDKERDALMRAMKAIHQAGVRHHDIRSDNILVNQNEEAFIIDFDRAELTVFPSEALERELNCMQHIVDGKGDTDRYYS